MRLLLEIVVVAALIALAWEKPWKEWVSEAPLVGNKLVAPAKPQAPVVRSPTRASGAGAGTRQRTTADHPLPTKDNSFTGHVFYLDDKGVRYWLDAQGQRHYEP